MGNNLHGNVQKIMIIFIKFNLSSRVKDGQTPSCLIFSDGCTKSRRNLVSLILKIHRWGIKNMAHKQFPFFLFMPVLFIFSLRRSSNASTVSSGIRPKIFFCQEKRSLCPLPIFFFHPDNTYFSSDFSLFYCPAIPFAKLFCRQRKIIAVGSVQISTPNINIP